MSIAPPTSFLLVKLSSLGDVLHNLPIVWDIRSRYPNAKIDWVVEEGYVDLLKPLQSTDTFRGIDQIIPIALRRWKKNVFRKSHWQELQAMIQMLRIIDYDVVIDSQGLIKSAVVSRLSKRSANGVITGLANATEYSGYEPLARLFYSESVQVPKQCHAIDRSRHLLGSALQTPPISRDEIPTFYPKAFVEHLLAKDLDLAIASEFRKPYVLCFHATARDAKQWNLNHWVEVGRYLVKKGFHPIFPWGNNIERQRGEWLVAQIGGGTVPSAYSVKQYFGIVSHAKLTIGVDTGLTHLAAVLDRPTIEIYCDSPRWKTGGYWSKQVINLGDIKSPPSVSSVIKGIDQLL
jgi:heptosyltransferase I